MVANNIIITPDEFTAIWTRFWKYAVCVDSVADTCWHWLAGKTSNGYGAFSIKHRNFPAHRIAWVLTYGSIDPALTIDHLCRNRACVNPAHLELVTNRVNILRGESIIARHAQQSACIHGHAFTAENTYITPKTRQRKCRACIHEYRRRALVRGRLNRVESVYDPKLTESQVRDIRQMHATRQWTIRYLATFFGVSTSLIDKIVARDLWRHVL